MIYRILNLESARRGDNVYKSGRKPILASYKRDIVEAVKDDCFRFIAFSYYINISAINLSNSFKREI
jgi:hypothetical protein